MALYEITVVSHSSDDPSSGTPGNPYPFRRPPKFLRLKLVLGALVIGAIVIALLIAAFMIGTIIAIAALGFLAIGAVIMFVRRLLGFRNPRPFGM